MATNVNMFELMRKGGKWLASARNVLQCKARNGDRLIWGSHDLVVGLTVRDIEEMAACVAASAINEYMEDVEREYKRLEAMRRITES